MSTLKAIVTADVSNFNRAMTSVGASAKSAGNIVKGVFAGIAGATLGLGTVAVKTSLKYERLEKRLQSIFGKQEGTKYFNEITKAAAESSANTEDLLKASAKLSAFLGKRPSIDLTEAVTFSAMTLESDPGEVASRVGRFFNNLEAGEIPMKKTRDLLRPIFGKEFMDKVKRGQGTFDEAMSVLLKRGAEMKEIYGTGLGKALSILEGSWAKFLRRIGEGKTLESIEKLVESVSKILEDLASSGVLEELGEEFSNLVNNIKADDIKSFLSGSLEIMQAMVKAMAFIVEHWKTILPLAIAYKTAMVTASLAKASSVGGGMLGNVGGGMLGKAGVVGATAYVGYKAGNMLADYITEDFDKTKQLDYGADPRIAELRRQIKERKNSEVQNVRVIQDSDEKNAFKR